MEGPRRGGDEGRKGRWPYHDTVLLVIWLRSEIGVLVGICFKPGVHVIHGERTPFVHLFLPDPAEGPIGKEANRLST